ncbi:MAG: hypothetical protein WCD89_25110 [Anaerocolumna sp.]
MDKNTLSHTTWECKYHIVFAVGANAYSTSDLTKKGNIGSIIITFNMNSIFGFNHNQKSAKLADMIIYDRNWQNLHYYLVDCQLHIKSSFYTVALRSCKSKSREGRLW